MQHGLAAKREPAGAVRHHAGYVAAVKAGAKKAMDAGFLLEADANRLIDEAEKSNVLQ